MADPTSSPEAHPTDPTALPEGFLDLRLYVAGQTPRSVAAIANLKKICEEHLAGKYRVEVVDLMLNPDPGPQAPGAGAEDHRRPLADRAGAPGARLPTPELI